MKAARKIYNNVATNEPGTLLPLNCQLRANIAIVTPLQARTFGIWTLTSGVVRWYCAYNIHQKVYVATLLLGLGPLLPATQRLRHDPLHLPPRICSLLPGAACLPFSQAQPRLHEPRCRLKCASFVASRTTLTSPLFPRVSRPRQRPLSSGCSPSTTFTFASRASTLQAM